VPVLEGALDRSLELASSMDARGYGRRSAVPLSTRRWSFVATGGGLFLLMAGIFDALSPAVPWGFGLFAMVVGVGLLGVGMVLSGRRTRRTRYRPDGWGAAEWGVTASGLAVVATLSVAGALHVGGLEVSFYPLAFPAVPLLACSGVLLGLLPSVVAPALAPRTLRRRDVAPTAQADGAKAGAR
jgi:energy-coupling factor transport system permease protein